VRLLRLPRTTTIAAVGTAALTGLATLGGLAGPVLAEQPNSPCTPNPQAAQDVATVLHRGDVVHLPVELQTALARLADRPHSQLPLQIFAEADSPSQLFQYYLLDTTGFEPNVFTKIFAGVNDQVQLTATGPNCNLPTVGTVRIALEPKPGLPTDPNDPRAFNDVFTDVSGLFVINNESGWYEGWMIHDLTVPSVNPTPRQDGQAQFGSILPKDAELLEDMGTHNNVAGHVFTMDGRKPHLPSAADHFPDRQTNVVPINVSMGAWNSLQQSDAHAYWEFNYTGTNWVHPLYELPFTGGFPDNFGQAPNAFADGEIGRLLSLVPGPGPDGTANRPQVVGDNPNLPRDPDKFDGTVDSQREFRQRGIPSGLANEVFLDVYERRASFEPDQQNLERRLFDAYSAEIERVSPNGHGIITAVVGDIDTPTDGFANNERLYLPPTVFNRFAVTREINDGSLAPRFAPSQRAWVLAGTIVKVDPAVAASAGRDSDNR
jgi:hypothetical protein